MTVTAALTLLMLVASAPAVAAPVTVRFPEGTTRAFIVLHGDGPAPLAAGEAIQTHRGDRLENHLLIRFKDGSVHDEAVTFSQQKVLRLLSYRLTQRGPSFPKPTEVAFDRDTGRYRARISDETAEGTLDLPEDVHNGMTGLVLRHLPPGAGGSGHIVAFTPKPRMLRSELRIEGDDRFFIGHVVHTATRYVVKLELGGLTGTIAGLLGKEPPELRYWIATGAVPAFVKFEGAMYVKGPRWRVEQTPPRWSNALGATSR